ncbi:hypothetical protein CLU83_3523 [Flavobacterium sp. 1]|uniref:hypothetical protein n=1 Tax=Flavobacterium sp. 1 TaxID=2035200 RepID=UPI000C24EC8B|nr:hypothetical protein [Flavobacterium sp. 1]PJJ10132.1 hypothetical protein CLU83_3523 [Flavobacterium sp. 1]
MNIIQLFALLDLKRDQILDFDSEDFIRIEKKINFEKKINPEIDSKAGENLIRALKEYKEVFLFLMSNRTLFNFLSKNNLSKNNFPVSNGFVSDEKVKGFIAVFLADDLLSFFSLKLSTNTYNDLEELDYLLDAKNYLPEEIIYKMASLVFSKLDFSINQLCVTYSNDFSNIIFIRYTTFYGLLTHFRTFETDQKISDLLSLVIVFYQKKIDDSFFTAVIQSMAFYKAFDENVNETLIKNRASVTVFTSDGDPTKKPVLVSILIGLICAVIPFLATKCS